MQKGQTDDNNGITKDCSNKHDKCFKKPLNTYIAHKALLSRAFSPVEGSLDL
jgi:hypothetical protein